MYQVAILAVEVSPAAKTAIIIAMVIAGLLLMFGKPLLDKIKEAQAKQKFPAVPKPSVPNVPVVAKVTVGVVSPGLDAVMSQVTALIVAGQERQSQEMIDDALNFLRKYVAIPPKTVVSSATYTSATSSNPAVQ